MQKFIQSGTEDFKDVITSNCYYVDKTKYIKELFDLDKSKVILITRPRRFGKTLTLSTFKYFLSNQIDKDEQKDLFKDTQIINDTEFCQNYMGQYPVLSLSLKRADKRKFETSYDELVNIIFNLANEHRYLLNSEKLAPIDKKRFEYLLDIFALTKSQSLVTNSLVTLTELLYKHFDKKAIVLIDEYDVPLDAAARFNYYDDMIDIVRGLLANALKTNSYLEKAILTGCLRVTKESIFTGLNNLNVNSIFDINNNLATAIGFTDTEVKELLTYFGFDKVYDGIKNWYDGYNLDGHEIYCPWSVLKYINSNINSNDKSIFIPHNYWVNTSSNSIIKEFLGYLTYSDTDLMQSLVDGNEVDISVNENLSYTDLLEHDSKDFWSLLLYTGYLTVVKKVNPTEGGSTYKVRIPNNEIKECFKEKIIEYFTQSDAHLESSDTITKYALNGDATKISILLNENLKKYISIRDASTKSNPKNYYHGFMLGYFSQDNHLISELSSNTESGNGYADVMFTSVDTSVGVIIELKVASSLKDLESAATTGLEQIINNNYQDNFTYKKDIKTIHAYGISFFKKDCYVVHKVLKDDENI